MSTPFALSDTLFGRTRGAMLAVFYGHIGESWYLRQLARLTGIAIGPVQRELRQLVDAGLVTRKTLGTNILYGVNQHSPVFAEMKRLVAKTVGMRDVLLAALQPIESRITLALVQGLQSAGAQPNALHLVVIGKVTTAEIVNLLSDARKTLNREITPTIYTLNDFKRKMRGTPLKAALSGQKLFVIGDEKVLGQLARR